MFKSYRNCTISEVVRWNLETCNLCYYYLLYLLLVKKTSGQVPIDVMKALPRRKNANVRNFPFNEASLFTLMVTIKFSGECRPKKDKLLGFFPSGVQLYVNSTQLRVQNPTVTGRILNIQLIECNQLFRRL